MAESHSPISGESDSGRPAPSFENWSWEWLEYLARSPKRIRVLHVLDENTHRKGELSDTLNIPRSTLLRTLREMREYGWVIERQNGLYEITLAGSGIVDMFEEFYRQLHSIAGLTKLEQVLPLKLTDCPEFRSLLQGDIGYDEISTYVSTADSPYEPMRQFAEELRSTDVECLFLGVANPFYSDALERALESDSISSLIVSRNVVNELSRINTFDNIRVERSDLTTITEDQFRYNGFTTAQNVVIEGLNEDDLMTQVVVELSLTVDIVREWFEHIGSTL
ncbi:hypothetical protein [Halarchaeum nitratireducens]|uniref:HVO-A0261-like N-terminal domain-containing protein n=1 Tax=Halarchaeum nitratireducens TaxID=489913 RepID=A0A830G9G2_9EURY|nr:MULTISPECIES: hypothetical protein [Halarchaeum]MBP2249828.1 putative transcriptional regulator [Halarchaeum solikamskense]GGN10307.1 hypothetical protein GCM10009021_07640 [Halarchaeum nitratireducens]